MNHTEPESGCVGCIRGRLAVQKDHESAVRLASALRAEFYGVGRCPERRSCPSCGAPGKYHATHCRMQRSFDRLVRAVSDQEFRDTHLPKPGAISPMVAVQEAIAAVKADFAISGRQHQHDQALSVDGQKLVVGRIVRYVNMALSVDGQKLVVGRIVRYVSLDHPFEKASEVWAALVTRVPKLVPPTGAVDLLIFSPAAGPIVRLGIAYDAAGSAGTWHWPVGAR